MTSNQKSPHAQVSDLVPHLAEVRIDEGAGGEEALEEFRKEWKKEVASKRPAAPGGVSVGNVRWKEDLAPEVSSSAKDKASGKKPVATSTTVSMPLDRDDPAPGSSTLANKSSPPTFKKSLPRTAAKKEDAITLYARAVESEQSGKLNEALQLYRRAFKLDDNVDRAYAKSSLHRDNLSQLAAPPTAESGEFSFQRHIQTAPDYERHHLPSSSTGHSRTSPLTAILQKAPMPTDEMTFQPAEEDKPVHIAALPGELIDGVLGHLAVADIERFAVTCWRARALTANSPIWKRITEGIYRNPSIYDPKVGELVKRHKGEWRTTLLEEERVRMDGCYISVCHYIRPGAGEQWVTVTHMITYHRFLRFYPDGKVISFLTTDHPSEVVPLLRPSLRGKGLHFGTWRLIRSDQIDPSAAEGFLGKNDKPRAKILISDLLEPGVEEPKYEFEMELGLRETGRGRWNKLDIQRYSSINLGNGETLALSLKHQKPFYFSKVLSYHPQL